MLDNKDATEIMRHVLFKLKKLKQCSFCLLASLSLFLIGNTEAHATPPPTQPLFNIYLAEASDEKITQCGSGEYHCDLSPLANEDLDQVLLQLQSSSDDSIKALLANLSGTDYDLLISSTLVKTSSERAYLALEFMTTWRGVPIDFIKIDTQQTEPSKQLKSSLLIGIKKWLVRVSQTDAFESYTLYKALGASDYINELSLPRNIGDFALSKQHLNADPFEGMLSRYIHKDFDLAVLDIYVYPLLEMQIEEQLRMSLSKEQADIKSISIALGEDALEMSEIKRVDALSKQFGVDVFAFEAKLETAFEPLFVSQYAYVKEDKIVRFSANVPMYVTDSLIPQAIGEISVPMVSTFMQQLREPLTAQLN